MILYNLVFEQVNKVCQLSCYSHVATKLESSCGVIRAVEREGHKLVEGGLCLLGSQGGAVRHHTVQPRGTNGIKTSCLIRHRPGDELESAESCKLIFSVRTASRVLQ